MGKHIPKYMNVNHVQMGNYDQIVLLLLKDQRTNVNKKNPYNGNTVLHYASARGDFSIVEALLRCGKVNITQTNDDGHTADQPETARPGAMTRSGRISRPPLWYGLGGDVLD